MLYSLFVAAHVNRAFGYDGVRSIFVLSTVRTGKYVYMRLETRSTLFIGGIKAEPDNTTN